MACGRDEVRRAFEIEACRINIVNEPVVIVNKDTDAIPIGVRISPADRRLRTLGTAGTKSQHGACSWGPVTVGCVILVDSGRPLR